MSSINTGNFIRFASDLQDSYEKGSVYRKKWSQRKGRLANRKGFDRFRAEVKHAFGYTKDEKRFNKIFDRYAGKNPPPSQADLILHHYRSADLGKTYRAISQLTTAIPKTTIPNVESIRTQIEDHRNVVLENVKDALIKTIAPRVDNAPFDFEVFVTHCAGLITKKDPQENEINENFFLSVLEHIPNIELLYHSLDKGSEDFRAIAKLRNIYKEALPEIAYKLHKEYASPFNTKKAIDLAQEGIPFFQAMFQPDVSRVRSVGVQLVNMIRYGRNAGAVMRGEQKPSIFWELWRIWNTAKSLFNKDHLAIDDSQRDNLTEHKKLLHSDLDRTINRLHNKPNEELRGGDVDKYIAYLLKTHKLDESAFIREPIGGQKYNNSLYGLSRFVDLVDTKIKDAIKQAKKTNSEVHKFFIPFVFPKKNFLFHDHIVLITIDFDTKQIQYYDPQGLPPDHPNRLVFKDMNMKDALKQIRERIETPDVDDNKRPSVPPTDNRPPLLLPDEDSYSETLESDDENSETLASPEEKSPKEIADRPYKFSIVSNTTIHQEDKHNCGVYVCDHMERQIDGETFEEICLEGRDPDDIIDYRKEMACKLNRTEVRNEIIDYLYTENTGLPPIDADTIDQMLEE